MTDTTHDSDEAQPDGPIARRADIPMPDEAQLLYPDVEAAAQAAEELSLDGVHEHELDGEAWWTPGADHETFREAMADVTEQEASDRSPRVFDIVTDDLEEFEEELLGVAVDFPNHDVYVDWNLSAWGDEALENPHVSIYGSIDDLEQVSEGTVEPREGFEVTEQEGEKVDECVKSYLEDNPDADENEAYAVCNAQFSGTMPDLQDILAKADLGDVQTVADSADQKAAFSEGDAVRWTWQGNPVHGRVAEKREEAATPEGSDQQITGDDDEAVYLIDEWDDRVGGYRRENIAKPESSLDESQKDLPPRDENNYVDSQAWAALTTPVSQSIFTAQELTHAARSYDDVLQHSRPNEWLLPSEDPVVYRYEVPEKYLEGRSEEFFVPNAAMADAARKVQRWEDEHDDIAGGAADGEGARRRAQIIEHYDRGEPLAVEYWEEIRAYHDRHHSQGNHELGEEAAGEPWTAAGYVSHLNWGGDAGYEQAQRVMDAVEATEQESRITMKGAVAAEQSLPPRALTKADSNEVDLAALDGELREAVEADEFYVYGKASVEQWDDDEPPTLIQMDALEQALDRYFSSETAPGIISRHHQDIPVGTPVRSFEFSEATTLEIDGETYEFEAGDEVRTHVQDADGDGRPELWLAANIDGETEMGKKTRVLAAQGDLNGFSVTVHRNQDETTQEGRLVTDCDLHAVTIGSDEQIKNPGSEFDVADFKGPLKRVRDRVVSFIS